MTDIQELLPLVALNLASPEERAAVQAALESSAALRAEYAQLRVALTGLGATTAEVPPAGLKAKILAAARADNLAAPAFVRPAPQMKRSAPKPQFSRGLPWLMGGAATFLTAIAVVFFAIMQSSPSINATAVVSTPQGDLVYANSGEMSRTAPVVLVRANGQKIPVVFAANKACKFEAAVSSDGLTYLLDSANNKVFILEESTGKLVDEWDVPANATAMDVVAGTVVVRSSKVALIFRRNQSGEKSMVEARISTQSKGTSVDAAVIDGQRLFITDQDMGLVRVLEVGTGRELMQFKAAKAPVSLAVRDGLWVLDAVGALYHLDLQTGAVLDSMKLEGAPSLLRLTDERIFVADKQGFVTVLDWQKKVIVARKRLQNLPMALSSMPDGHVAVALEKRGIVVLDNKLDVVKTVY